MFHIPTDSETLLSSTYPLPTLCLRVLVFDSDVVPPPLSSYANAYAYANCQGTSGHRCYSPSRASPAIRCARGIPACTQVQGLGAESI